ncbi:hypothetical protein [Nonomuraea endophytica]|uniref:hypothetical protein n=1 Tax=Nonomuraea endophytica TaxID=714136 RepID=UPI0037CA9E90
MPADSAATLLGPSVAYSHVLIMPSGSAFARWLVEQQIAVVTEAGEVALPYAGCRTQTLALAQSLIVRLRDVSTTVTSGSAPP